MIYKSSDRFSSPRLDREVAIIGMEVRLPEADTIQALLHNLRTGRDSVREISTDRKLKTSLPLGETYQLCGFLDDIDTFDYAFFKLSKGEANRISPQHRMLLQASYRALEHAGYNPVGLSGTRASVYLADTKIVYDQLSQVPDSGLVMGSHVSAMAGRISRFFGLCGPAVMVDTACSSSLSALYFAVNDLLMGESEFALVGCASLNILADRITGELDIGIRSPDGKTRCFSAEAAGTGSGEAVVVIVLKRHDRARQDSDVIHSVIKGMALNHVGGRSSSLTAPDARSEAEVIERAWDKAQIDPETISFIEAHGTATRLGDPIEIEGIDLAFSRVTTKKQFCSISSIKSNIGHTWSAAGLVGLVKATLSLKYHELYPNVHSAHLNPLIDFKNSAVTVTQQLTSWSPISGIRRAGVSAFGVMGTNAHVVLEEAQVANLQTTSNYEGSLGSSRYWIPVSARSIDSLNFNLEALWSWLQAHPDLQLADIQKTLVGSRGHFEYRFSLSAVDRTELDQALRNPSQCIGTTGESSEGVTLALVCSGQCLASPGLTTLLRSSQPVFDRLYTDCENASTGISSAHVAQFAFQFAFHGWLNDLGFRFKHLVSEGVGRMVVAAIRGRISLAEAIQSSLSIKEESLPLSVRVDRFLDEVSDQRILFIEAGPLSTVTQELQLKFEKVKTSNSFEVFAIDDGGGEIFSDFFAKLYRSGASWKFAKCEGQGRRVELPGYQFQKIHCWLDDVQVSSSSPVTTLEGVSQVWKEILGLEQVAPESSFFALGGDSISGLQTVARINSLFGVSLDDYALFEHRTLADLVNKIDELRQSVSGTPANVDTVGLAVSVKNNSELFPASSAQTQVWLGSQFEGGSIAFNLHSSFKLTGNLEIARLQRAVNAVLERHEALRATFQMIGDALMQKINPVVDSSVTVEFISNNMFFSEGRTQEIVREFVSRKFDLEKGPLLRIQLLQTGTESQVLTISTHHIVVDGWSLGLLVRDLSSFIASDKPNLPTISVPYRQHLVQLEAVDQKKKKDDARYWLTKFSEIPPLLELPTYTHVQSTAFQGSYVDHTLPESLSRQLKKMSQAQNGTNFTSFVALFAAFFSRYTNDGRMVLGTSVLGEGRSTAENLVSMLVRIIPLQLKVDSTHSLLDLFKQVRVSLTEALTHQSYTYEELLQTVQQSGQLQSSHLFSVLIDHQEFGAVGKSGITFLENSGVTATPFDIHLETCVFPLNIMLSEQSDGFHAVFRFDLGMFDHDQIQKLWRGFIELVTVLLSHPSQPINALPLLTEEESERIRVLGYRTLDFDSNRLVHQEIERYAVETPSKVCLSSQDGILTFAELEKRTNQLARYFCDQHHVKPGDLVALVMDRSQLLIESILAIWKCGAAYMPIDPSYPSSFVSSILQTAQVSLALYDSRQLDCITADQLRKDGHKLFSLSDQSAAQEDSSKINRTVSAADLAYVIYTSGSTGVPKGAMVEHHGMLNHLHAKVVDLGLSKTSIIAQNAPSSFDISVWQMFAALFVGGKTVVFSPKAQLDPLKFINEIECEKINVLEVVPSYLNTLLDILEQSNINSDLTLLQYLIVTGEELYPCVVNRWFSAFPSIPLVNAYGPTEASDDITHHLLRGPISIGSVPIGRPIPNTLIYLLDSERRVVPEGEVGDLYVSGICVGRGYLHDPEQTAKVFICDPFIKNRRMYRTGDRGRWNKEGALEFHGRKDNQLKVRGFRLDVGELERRLSECADIKNVVVGAAPNAKDQLIAYVVLQSGGSIQHCRDELAKRLPHYMVPAIFIELEKLPLTNNGKVDRKALEKLDVTALKSRSSSPIVDFHCRDEVLEVLTQIWVEVLNRADFGPEDRFLDLGGNSLRAMQVRSRIYNRLNIDLPLEALFEHKSLSALALCVMASKNLVVDSIQVVENKDTYPVAPAQELLLQIERNYDARAAFNRNDLYHLHGQLDPDLLIKALAYLIEEHESLRTTFSFESGSAVQTVHKKGALPLPFQQHDFMDLSAVKKFAAERIRVPFNIRRESLVRADLLSINKDDYFLLVSMHQLISDGRSAQVLKDTWLSYYHAFFNHREPPAAISDAGIQAKDAAVWLRKGLTSQEKLRHRIFWKERLLGASSILTIPTSRTRPLIATLDGDRVRVPISKELTRQIASLARDLAITEFVIVQVATSFLLMGCTGSKDVTIGTYVRGRSRTDLEDQIGFYINTVPIRLQIDTEDHVKSILVRAQREVLELFEHQDYPYGWTMEDLGWYRGLDRSPLFDVMIAFGHLEEDPKMEHGLETVLDFESLDLPRRSKEADLNIVFNRLKESMELAITYNTDLFSLELSQQYAECLISVLTAMVDQRPISEILKQGRVK